MHPILSDRRRLQVLLVAWCLVGVMLGFLVRTLIAGAGWGESFFFAVPLGLAAAPFSLSSWYVCRALPLARVSAIRAATTALAASLVTAAVWSAIGYLHWTLIVVPDRALVESSKDALVLLLMSVGALAYLLSMAVNYVVQAFEASAEASQRVLESQVAQRDAELRALRAQIDPHFLFNSLNSINGLIVPAPEKARMMCQMLGDFLRDSLKVGAAHRIPLAREVALVEQYLNVEQVRFGSRLRVTTRVSDDTADVPVPPLILQPLVENAVRHGIGTCVDGGEITVSARLAGDIAVLEVINPRDIDGARKGTGLGLDIVRRRLAASFGDRASIAVEPSETQYRVVVTVPVEDNRND